MVYPFHHIIILTLLALMIFKHKSDDKVLNGDLQIANQVRHPLVSERCSLSFSIFSLRQPENVKKLVFEKNCPMSTLLKKTRYVLIIYEQTQ